MKQSMRQSGFTLVEIAIVVLIITILLGYTVAMFPMQQELKQYRAVDAEMDRIVDHLIGFAQVNGRLPCPDTNGDVNGTLTLGVLDGLEDVDDEVDNTTGAGAGDGLPDNCKGFYGFLPAGTIGISGNLNQAGALLDPWGQPYRYHVSNADAATSAATTNIIDLVSPGGVRAEGLSNVAQVTNLVICRDNNNPSAVDVACTDAVNDTIVTDAAVVIYSSGRDQANVGFASNVQNENRDNFQNGTADFVYVSTTRSDNAGTLYDDRVRWIAPALLFTKMIQADQLP